MIDPADDSKAMGGGSGGRPGVLGGECTEFGNERRLVAMEQPDGV